jgi:uncharacterized protein YaeQ
MAIKSSVYKLNLDISDCNKNYFNTHQLILSKHPSETEQRLMVRVLAFALNASESLSFSKGLCADDEPEIWDKNLSDEILNWISLGQVDIKLVKKSLGRSKEVVIFTYAGNKSKTWWQQNQTQLEKFNKLKVVNIKVDDVKAMEQLVSRNMDLQCTIQDELVYLSNAEHSLTIEPELLLYTPNA